MRPDRAKRAASRRPWRHHVAMNPAGAHRVLVERGELLSWLMLPGMSEEQAAPAAVRFSAEDGVTLLLLDAPQGWPIELGDRGELIVHGVTVDGGHLFTVLGSRVNRLADFDQARSMHATTLALGAHLDRTTTWKRRAREPCLDRRECSIEQNRHSR